MGDEALSADELVAAVREAVAEGDVSRVKLLLHPYLLWTFDDGASIRGRTRVLQALSARRSLGAPAVIELRDGQIYRWVARS